MKIIGREFFERDTLKVARDLLGCFLVRKIGNKTIRAMIVDVEAYVGEDDLACHASKGRTPRSEVLYGEAGRVYVYLIYGMYYIMNVVTEKKNFPSAVMIRSVANLQIANIHKSDTNNNEWVDIFGVKLDGPGKVCREFKIDKKFHNFDITKGEKLWIEKGNRINRKDITATKRIGITYAQHCAHYPWRFVLKEHWRKK